MDAVDARARARPISAQSAPSAVQLPQVAPETPECLHSAKPVQILEEALEAGRLTRPASAANLARHYEYLQRPSLREARSPIASPDGNWTRTQGLDQRTTLRTSFSRSSVQR